MRSWVQYLVSPTTPVEGATDDRRPCIITLGGFHFQFVIAKNLLSP
jgi:hypothetical protein